MGCTSSTTKHVAPPSEEAPRKARGTTTKSLESSSSASVSSATTKKTVKSTMTNRHNNKDDKTLVLYSDFTCAYCYLEFLQLKQILERLPPKKRLVLKHGAFQLDGTLPNEGVDKYEFLQNFMSKESLDVLMDQLCGRFRTYGLEMNRGGLLGNSAAAHRLQIWAEENCDNETAIRLKDELFKIHSCKGKSMGDLDALRRAATKVGLGDKLDIINRVISHDRNRVQQKYATAMKRQIDEAKGELGIESVPALVLVEGRKEKKSVLGKSTDIADEEVGFSNLVLSQCS